MEIIEEKKEGANPENSNTERKTEFDRHNHPGLFKKGDKRINRKGRPKTFDQLRKMVVKISHEIINPKDPIEKQLTVAEGIARNLAKEDPKHFLEIAFGKVPQPVELQGSKDKPLRIVVERENNDKAD